MARVPLRFRSLEREAAFLLRHPEEVSQHLDRQSAERRALILKAVEGLRLLASKAEQERRQAIAVLHEEQSVLRGLALRDAMRRADEARALADRIAASIQKAAREEWYARQKKRQEQAAARRAARQPVVFDSGPKPRRVVRILDTFLRLVLRPLGCRGPILWVEPVPVISAPAPPEEPLALPTARELIEIEDCQAFAASQYGRSEALLGDRAGFLALARAIEHGPSVRVEALLDTLSPDLGPFLRSPDVEPFRARYFVMTDRRVHEAVAAERLLPGLLRAAGAAAVASLEAPHPIVDVDEEPLAPGLLPF